MVEDDFGRFSLEGEATRPSRFTRGFLSNEVCFVLFCVSVLRVFDFFWFGFCTFLTNQIVKRSKISKAPNLDTDRTDS